MRVFLAAFVAVIVLTFAPTATTASGVLDPRDAALSALLSDMVQRADAVGVAAAIVRNGEVTFLETYGTTQIDGGRPIDPDTVFRIASLSKAFAASAASDLVLKRELSLTDPVSTFAPEFRLKAANGMAALTLENVLSHRTSLPPYAYDNMLEAGVAPPKILDAFAKVDPICPVGQCYAYQNVAFDTVARAVEAAAGVRYANYVEDRFFKPLGMTRASFGLSALTRDDNWARPFRRKPGEAWRITDVGPYYYDVPAAGGVNASITDMAQWLKAQMGHAENVLSPEILQMTHASRIATPGEVHRMKAMSKLEAAHYGLGWRIYIYAGETVINHSGSVDSGYAAQIAFLPGRDVGIVLLTNSRAKRFFEILPAFLDGELATPGPASGVAPD